jgi:hypothetical protein
MIDEIAVNSISIVLKVRYVACGLLDAGEGLEITPSPAVHAPGSPGGKRAENSLRESLYCPISASNADGLVDFVDILAKLDKINRITEGW